MTGSASRASINREMAQLGLASLGAVAAVGGAAQGNRNMAVGGTALVAGVAAVSAADEISMKRGKATNPNFVPDQHIYRPFSVPGRLFVRKWILLNKKVSQRINALPLEITYVDGKKEVRNATIKLPIR